MNSEQTFGRFVRQRRRELDLTQEELARRVGCAAITIRKIEADDARPSVQIAERLAMALAIPLDERAEFVRQARTARPEAPLPIETPAPALDEIGREDLTGRAIRGYALAEKIGMGGMGAVYRAVQPLVEREVAVKIILPAFANHPDFIRRFEAEAQLVARLEHPHIVPLYDYWREPGVAYLVMRLLRGGSVQSLLQSGSLPLETVSRLLEQICLALHSAHRIGVIHRDLKPGNVLLDEDQNAYLADFGIAKNLGNPDLESQTQMDALVGSPQYMSPEQIRSLSVRPQTDIYCLGVMLYEMLTGALPFTGPTPFDLLQQHIAAPLPVLAAHRTGLPAALDAVIARAAAKDPEERYADTLGLLDDFRRALNDGAVTLPIFIPDEEEDTGEAVNPYKGLRAFSEADADDFFGRETLIQQLLARLSEGGELAHFLAVIGPSGSGKSSVVKAGLIPTLRRGGLLGSENWFYLDFLPGPHPFEELEATLLRVAVNPPASLLEQLKSDSRGLLRAVNRILPNDKSVELVLVIDQFEELFTLTTDEAERALFLSNLVTAIMDEGSRLRVVITLRADFTDRPLRYVDFGELVQRRSELVLPLTPDELERAILGPARRGGLKLEAGLISTMIRAVGDQPGALPLLQYALTELFERREGRMLTKSAYDSIGGVLGALGRRAEEVYAGLNEADQAAARQLFLRLVTLGEGVEDTRRRVLRAELDSISNPQSLIPNLQSPINTVVEVFGKSRLLAFDRDPVTRVPTVEVAHEALLREWGRLREWLAESRADVRLQRQLATAAVEWQATNRDASFLLSGTRLAHFEGWAANTSVALTHDERAFLDASITERKQYEAKEAERQRRELEAAQKLAETERQSAVRLRLRNRVITAVGALAIMAAIIAALLGGSANNAAQNNATLAAQNAAIAKMAQAANTQVVEQRNVAVGAQATAVSEAQVRATQQAIAEANFTRAEAQRLAAEANNLISSNGSSELIALLTLRSLNLEYSPQGDAALQGAANLDYPLQLFAGQTNFETSVAFSPDGQYVLSGGLDNSARLFDIDSGEMLRIFSGHSGVLKDMAFSSDGQWILTGSADRTARLWDATTGQEIRSFTGHGHIVIAVAFSPDGKNILTGSDDKQLRLWDVQTGQELNHWLIDDPVSAFSADGRYVLAYSETEKAYRLWDIQTLTVLQKFPYPNPPSRDVVLFSPDGEAVLVGYANGDAVLWEAASGQELQVFKGHTDGVLGLAFSPDGKYILSGSWDRTARLWDIQTGQEVRRLDHSVTVGGVAFSPDGEAILTTSDDGTARLWDIQPRPELPLFISPTGMGGMAFSPDGTQLATISSLDEMRLWDVVTGQTSRIITGTGFAAWGLKYSPDGKYLLTGNLAGVTSLWDAETGQEVRQFPAQEGLDEIYHVAFSPDGKYIVAGGLARANDETFVPMWDIQTGKEVRRFPVPSIVYFLSFSPDGKYVLTAGGDGVSRLWDAQTGTKVREFSGGGAVFSPDGKYAITVAGAIASLRDVETGEEVRRFVGPAAGFAGWVYSPDGNTFAAVHWDGTVRVWGIETGLELRRYPHPTVSFIAFSPDSQYLASASFDGINRLWDVDYHTTMAYLCSRLLRDFTDEERAQYNIPNDGPTCLEP